MVSTLDFESNNPSSNLGRTFFFQLKNLKVDLIRAHDPLSRFSKLWILFYFISFSRCIGTTLSSMKSLMTNNTEEKNNRFITWKRRFLTFYLHSWRYSFERELWILYNKVKRSKCSTPATRNKSVFVSQRYSTGQNPRPIVSSTWNSMGRTPRLPSSRSQ